MHGNTGRKRPDNALRNKSPRQILAVKAYLTGRPKSQSHRDALRKLRLGTHLSEETKAKLSKKLRGMKKPASMGLKQSLIRGAQRYNWKGNDVSKDNRKSRTCGKHKIWRRAVLIRDNYTCQACGQYKKDLEVDHELPFAFYPDLRFEVLNGRVLCRPCHRKTPTWGNSINVYA